jgi:hypothetical protein
MNDKLTDSLPSHKVSPRTTGLFSRQHSRSGMNVDLIGRISNVILGEKRPLQPLFEAVVNSIHAIQSLKIKTGRITITVGRDETQGNLGINDIRPVKGFTVEDNGVGFDDENYSSFTTSDTKFKQGAKGILLPVKTR